MTSPQKRIHIKTESGTIILFRGKTHIPGKRFTAKKIINMLRKVEVLV